MAAAEWIGPLAGAADPDIAWDVSLFPVTAIVWARDSAPLIHSLWTIIKMLAADTSVQDELADRRAHESAFDLS